jgi:hypothetical protein
MFKNKIGTWIFLGTILLACSCTQFRGEAGDPKKRLTAYISKSFSIKDVEERKELMAYLSGDVKTRLERWSDEQFREAFLELKREFLKLSFKEVKLISPSEAEITYEVSFIEQGNAKNSGKHEAKITNKKLCRMIMEKGQWYISEVRNIKELVEYKDELSLP